MIPTQPTPDDEKIMIDILFQLNKLKDNQNQFKKTITDFFDDMLNDDDTTDEQIK